MGERDELLAKLCREAIPVLMFHRPNDDLHIRMAKALEEEWRLEKPDMRHHYKPNRKYPWFCALCGYPEHERLKHFPAPPEED